MKKLPVFLFLLGLAVPSLALPGPTGFSFAKGAMFTVAGYTGASTLSGFPVLVRIAENSPSGFSYDDLQSKATGADIAFVGMFGAGAPSEIDTWNPSGTSLIWVRLPSMRNGTQFVMCWGSDSSGKAVCGTNPWSDYTGVWHMGETGTPSSSNPVTIHDSTANGFDGSTPVGGAASGSVVGGAWLISPDSNHDRSIRVPVGGSAADPAKKAAADALGTDFHASFWMRAKGVVQWANLICRRKGGILAKAQAAGCYGDNAFLFQKRRDAHLKGGHTGLGVPGLLKYFLRALVHQPPEIRGRLHQPPEVRGCGKQFGKTINVCPVLRKHLVKILAHAGFLAALAGEQKYIAQLCRK